MAISKPQHGAAGWDVDLNNALDALDSAASGAAATATAARQTADAANTAAASAATKAQQALDAAAAGGGTGGTDSTARTAAAAAQSTADAANTAASTAQTAANNAQSTATAAQTAATAAQAAATAAGNRLDGLAQVARSGSYLDLLNRPSTAIDGSIPYVVTRSSATATWKIGMSSQDADFATARALGRIVDFRSPAAAAPSFGVAPDMQHGFDTWLEFPAAAYDPSSIANLLYFWDPDTLTGADGSPVSTLPASVGAAALGQTTAARQPTVQTLSDGKRVIRFSPDGTATNDDYLSATLAASQAQPFTVFMVHSVAGTTATQQLMQAGTEVLIQNTGSLQAYAGTTLSLTGQTPPLSLGVTVVVFNGTTTKIYRSGGTPAQGNAGTTALSTAFRIGQHSSAGRPFSGDIGRLGIYSRALTLQEVNDLGTGLATQYATSAAWTAATV